MHKATKRVPKCARPRLPNGGRMAGNGHAGRLTGTFAPRGLLKLRLCLLDSHHGVRGAIRNPALRPKLLKDDPRAQEQGVAREAAAPGLVETFLSKHFLQNDRQGTGRGGVS
eukprot:scaffold3322_cov195-Pinguiococcus_pyrenoidosus.AAC.2